MTHPLLVRSLLGGIISVAAFSLTAPATKIAVASFSPLAVTGLRGLIAGVFCAAYLLIKQGPRPSRSMFLELLAIAAIGSCGFSVFLALGLQTVPAVHASVFLAMLPLTTAIFSQFVLPEPVSRLFWVGAGMGALISVGFMLHRSHGAIDVGDLFLLLSVLSAAWGYVRAAKLTRQLGGAAAMSWIIIAGSPLYLTLLLVGRPDFSQPVPLSSIMALGYLGMVSQSLGMFLWCWSLSTGFSALVSQTQMIQPFLSIFASAILLGEVVTPDLLWITLAVIGCVALSTYARLRRPRPRLCA